MVYLSPPLSPRARRLAVVGCCGLVLVVAALFQWHRQGPQPDLAGWDEARLARELEALGYHVHVEPCDRVSPDGRRALAGMYFWRDDAATTWEEAAAQMAGQAGRWRGLVVARPSPRSLRVFPSPEALQAGNWVLLGDPAELDRIARAIGVPR
jgi:hypothetical protein